MNTDYLNPELNTLLLADAVPVIKDVEFNFLEVRNGYCKSLLPLNAKSSNQHGTHQGMLMAMAGDYTGGSALASIFPNEPVLGVHEITAMKGMSLWLVASEMKYLSPSTEDVLIEAAIEQGAQTALIDRYFKGETIIFDVDLIFKNLDYAVVALGKFRYYIKKKNALTRNKPGQKMNIMFEHILKTSAKLIAQMRAEETHKPNPLFKDEFSHLAAGKQGKVIGERFMKLLPELQNMVAARTYHLDSVLKNLHQKKLLEQVVFLGAGLDCRTIRLHDLLNNADIYELDLQEMIVERERLFKHFNGKRNNNTKSIACNFLTENISDLLLASGFNPRIPSIFIFEGCSMYFTENENDRILRSIANLLKEHDHSYLWMDVISNKVFKSNQIPVNVAAFLEKIGKLGEPFIFGIDDMHTIFQKHGLSMIEQTNPAKILSDSFNEIYPLYRFLLLKHSHCPKQTTGGSPNKA